jgi:hypothetical protein
MKCNKKRPLYPMSRFKWDLSMNARRMMRKRRQLLKIRPLLIPKWLLRTRPVMMAKKIHNQSLCLQKRRS